MSIRLIDEIYSELYNGEKPPYTNTRGPKIIGMFGNLVFEVDPNFEFIGSKELSKFNVTTKLMLDLGMYVPKHPWILPPIVD